MTATMTLDLFAEPPSAPLPRPTHRDLGMRPYQRDALDATTGAFGTYRSVLVVSATGTGKTVYFAHLIDAVRDGRVLVLAHRDELIQQARDKIAAVTGSRPTIEKAGFRADPHSRVIVSSIQTQISRSARTGRCRMERFDPRDFALVIVDEAHRACSPSYRRVIAHYLDGNPGLKLVGVTATPDRHDQQALGRVFEHVAFRFPVFDAITEGWLVPVRQRSVRVTGLDLSGIRTTAGDLNGAELAATLQHEEMLHKMAAPTLDLAGCRQTLIFCASVAHAERFAEILNRHRPGSAASVSGQTDPDVRRSLFRDFGLRRFQFLANCDVATEGTDLPGVEVVVMGRPTKSRSKYEQMVGRGTRPHDSLAAALGALPTAGERRAAIAASPKPFCEVVDFVGNSGRHKLVTVRDVLGGHYGEPVRARAARKARERGGVPVDILDLLRASQLEVADERRRREAAEERERRRRARVVAVASYRVQDVSPFALYDDVRPPRQVGFQKVPHATDRQVELLRRRGFDVSPTTLTKGDAGRLIAETAGRITVSQAKVLRRSGYTLDEVRGLTLGQASQLIDRVRANGWQRVAAAAAAGGEVVL